jgi:hypothetical protein
VAHPAPRCRPLPIVLACGLLGCPPAPREPETLIDHGVWEEVSDSDNPFSADAPPAEDRSCEPLAIYNELFGAEDSVSIDMSACNYAVLTQPTRVAIPAGDFVVLRLWRDTTTFSTEAPSQMVVQIGEAVSWSDSFTNPAGSGGLGYAELPVEAEVPAGTDLYWLVDTGADLGARHGGNTVNLIELSRNDPSWVEED